MYYTYKFFYLLHLYKNRYYRWEEMHNGFMNVKEWGHVCNV